MTRLHVRHGQRSHPLYSTWKGMRQRCHDQRHPGYHRYGGAGVTVDSSWDDFGEFLRWALDAGWRPDLTLDRIDGSGNYEPSNCRWATPAEQAANSSIPHLVTAFGETMNVSQWARDTRCSVSRRVLSARLKAGLDPVLAITSPDRRGEANRRRKKQ